MKVFICKFFREEGIENKVRNLVSRQGRQVNGSVRVLCTDERVHQELAVAGIASEFFSGFESLYGHGDPASWEKVFEWSDEIRSSAENADALKYRGINFLGLEHDSAGYVLVIEFSRLCRQLQNDCSTLVLVLTGMYTGWFPDINSKNIRTLTYGVSNKTRNLRFSYLAKQSVHLVTDWTLGLVRKLSEFATSMPPTHPDRTGVEPPRVLLMVTQSLYARPAIVVADACAKNGLLPIVQRTEKYPDKLRMGAALAVLPKVPGLGRRPRRHIRALSADNAGDSAEAGEFSAKRLCLSVLESELSRVTFDSMYYIELAERLIETHRPDVICLMPHSFLPQQMMAAVARKHGIPTVACSAALETGNAPAFMRHLHADKIAAMGEVIKNKYIEAGLEPERIVVTGVAHFDRLFNRNAEQDKKVLADHGIDPEKKFIVFGTENLSVTETVQALNGVLEAALTMKDIQLVVKVHPTEPIEPYQAAAEKYNDPRIHVFKDIDLYALLSRCELVIVKFSTVALEAMMIGKPVIVINLSGQPTPVPYAEEGAALGVYRYEDIEPAIHKVLYNEDVKASLKAGRDKFVRAWAGEPDGKASQRIVDLMKEMISASKTNKELNAAS